MEFQAFWEMYPRKVGKLTAKRSWEKLSAENKAQGTTSNSRASRNSWVKRGTDWEFIPHPSSWLNQERFFDELVIEERKKEVVGWHRSDEGTLAKGREGRMSALSWEINGSVSTKIAWENIRAGRAIVIVLPIKNGRMLSLVIAKTLCQKDSSNYVCIWSL